MSEANMENLSAAMDGELSKEELRFLLRRLDHDASLVQTWTRYHVASESLRRQLPSVASAAFASRVMSAVEGEHVARSPRRDWLRLSLGGAIAAGVAVAALMVSQPTAPDAERPARVAANANGPTSQGVRAGASLAAANAAATPASHDVLAAVPPSLSPYSASELSQRASVTLGDPSENPLFQRYPGHAYSMQGYRALNNQDGSYLLLIDTPQARPAAAQGAR
ncbi:MAG TPA: sigma-E factor negative regulatory protein [Dyella sp.]|uniref:sigma-E factor negative regulatory protein n=1 Tax=Dyella sp. TaxID=1869338 RepID=UPI002B928F6A|nr:sigma-E factor negative regulatory protein [Dyella sp.]HUB92014.1 sigma-E factor negative regulatory protein [Dyella sp.]